MSKNVNKILRLAGYFEKKIAQEERDEDERDEDGGESPVYDVFEFYSTAKVAMEAAGKLMLDLKSELGTSRVWELWDLDLLEKEISEYRQRLRGMDPATFGRMEAKLREYKESGDEDYVRTFFLENEGWWKPSVKNLLDIARMPKKILGDLSDHEREGAGKKVMLVKETLQAISKEMKPALMSGINIAKNYVSM